MPTTLNKPLPKSMFLHRYSQSLRNRVLRLYQTHFSSSIATPIVELYLPFYLPVVYLSALALSFLAFTALASSVLAFSALASSVLAFSALFSSVLASSVLAFSALALFFLALSFLALSVLAFSVLASSASCLVLSFLLSPLQTTNYLFLVRFEVVLLS